MVADPAIDAGSRASRHGCVAGHDLRGSVRPGFIREQEAKLVKALRRDRH